MWNLHDDTEQPLSFWSVTTARKAGVGILLHPELAGRYVERDWRGEEGRGMVITSAEDGVVNVYAPNVQRERETFFVEVHEAVRECPERVLVLGDFNCVLDPRRDRVTSGKWATGRSESAQLDALVKYWRLVDAFETSQNHAETERDERTLTYWHQGHGARLDRGYVSAPGMRWLVGAEVRPPAAATDHHGLLLWMRDPSQTPLQSPIAPLAYPIRGRNPDNIAAEVELAVATVIATAQRNELAWDVTAAHLRDELREIRMRERRRAAKAMKKWRRRMRRQIHTLDDVIEYERKRTEKRLTRRRGARLGIAAGMAVLQRMSTRSRQVITKLNGTIELGGQSNADKMATAWEPMLSHSHAEEAATPAPPLFTVPPTARIDPVISQAITRPTTVEEVLATIKATGEHKAAGDDRLNNDFFRDWSELLAPYLVTEYNKLLAGATPPASFGTAIIVPIPKNGNSPDPMDYRPIALLQASYKILTKLVAYRLQAALGAIINEDQRGFVRGRQMADNIHIMQALLQQEFEFADDSAERSPGVLFIDFRKAYDTLDREFLLHALAQFGFDNKFITFVANMHTGTTARFLVNGDLSRAVTVATGIRQGCPLAPLLFLIAVETLKYAVEQTEGLRGIPLEGPHYSVTHNWSAFVDDSVVVLESANMLPELQNTLAKFARRSGLQIQPAKSQLVLLNARCQMLEFCGFPVLQPGDTVRYLGIQIGLGDLPDPNWRHRLKKLRSQIGRAAKFVSSVPDRVAVLNTVALPGLLFTAKYFTPSPTILSAIDQLWKQFLWNGTVTRAPLRAHKISPTILTQPRSVLGLGLQDPRRAMVAQAARTILDWNTKKDDKAWIAFHALLCAALQVPLPATPHTYPADIPAKAHHAVTGKTELLALGWKAVLQQMTIRYPIPDHLTQRRRSCIQALRCAAASLQWTTSVTGRFHVPRALQAQWQDVARRNYAAMAPELRSFWETFPWARNTWVVDGNGETLARKDFPGITARLLGDLQLRHDGDGVFSFRKPTVLSAKLHRDGLERLAVWIWTIIVNTGLLIDDQRAADQLRRVYSVNHHPVFGQYEWHVTDDGTMVGTALDQKWGLRGMVDSPDRIDATVGGWGSPVSFTTATGTERATQDLHTLRNDDHGPVILAGHPELHHGPVLITGRHQHGRPLTRHDLKQALRETEEQRIKTKKVAIEMICERLRRARTTQPGIADAIQSGQVTAVWSRHEGLSIYQQFFRYRLLLGALNTRGRDGSPLPCPHSFCPAHGNRADIQHILWECTGAQAVWHSIIAHWTHRERESPEDIQYHCFRPEAPVPSREMRISLITEVEDALPTDRELAVEVGWRIICAAAAHQLWLIRNDASFRDRKYTVDAIVAAIWKTVTGQCMGMISKLYHDCANSAIGRGLQTVLDAVTQPTSSPATTVTTIRMYYDGGARGNPGVSGAGSIILEQRDQDEWHIVWWQATYCGPRQTNNYAEHVGVATGLEECARRYGTATVHVDIIGDSALVTQQLHGRARVTTQKLRGPYTRSTTTLAALYSYACHHTRRAGNKMADHLANIAMDSSATTSWSETDPTEPNVHDIISGHLPGDVTAPTSTLRPTASMEENLRTQYDATTTTNVPTDRQHGPPTKKPRTK